MFWQGNKSHHIRKHNVRMYDVVLLYHSLVCALVFTTFSLLHSFRSSLLHARMQTTQRQPKRHIQVQFPERHLSPLLYARTKHHMRKLNVRMHVATLFHHRLLWAPPRARTGQFFCCHLNYDFSLYEAITVILLCNHL